MKGEEEKDDSVNSGTKHSGGVAAESERQPTGLAKPRGRVVYPAASFQPPDTCPECAAGVPFDEDGRHVHD